MVCYRLNDDDQISIFDLFGRILLEKSFTREGEIQLPQQLQCGIYFMNVMNDGELAWREKIIVMKN